MRLQILKNTKQIKNIYLLENTYTYINNRTSFRAVIEPATRSSVANLLASAPNNALMILQCYLALSDLT